MALTIWSPTNNKIDNRGTKVDPRLTTMTESNPNGWETLYTYSGGHTFQYRIDKQGLVSYREGTLGTVYNNLQNYADDIAFISGAFGGAYSEEKLQRDINNFKTNLQSILLERTKNIIPSTGTQPAPAAPAPGAQGNPGQTPGAADPGPGSEPTAEGVPIDATTIPKETFKSGRVGDFKYPSTIDNGQDRVVINQYQYKRSGVIQTETQLISKSVTQLLGSVILPMPNDLSESNSVGWGEDSLSNAAALLMGPAMKGVSLVTDPLSANYGQITAVSQDLKDALTSSALSTRIRQSLTVGAAAALLKKANVNVNPEAYISRVTSAAINPNLELLFSGPKLRQFALAYKMVARSQREAEQIRGILRFFKKGMAPQRSNKQEYSFFLGTPNVFRVEFKSGNRSDPLKGIGKFKTCALVSFSANYTPDGFYAAYNDPAAGGSQPISVTMQMGFTELTPVFNDEYDDEKMDDVGPNKFTDDYNLLGLNEPTSEDNSRSLENARRQAAAEGAPRPGTLSPTQLELQSGNGQSGGY